MQRYLLGRIGQAILTVVAVVSVTFVLARNLPGGPSDYILARLVRSNPDSFAAADVDAITRAYTNVDTTAPLLEQYLTYVTSVLGGDLGRSVIWQEPVASVLSEVLPWTVFLLTSAMLLTFLLGIGLGALMAYRERTRFDVVATIAATISHSVPYYVVAIVLVYVLAYQYHLFPPRGRVGSGVSPATPLAFALSAFHHAALPIVSFVVTGVGGLALRMRANTIQVLGENYLRVARLRGLGERRIVSRYVTRNAILPLYTDLMIRIGFLFGGAIVLEEIFGYIGVGYVLVRAIEANDHPLLLGGFLVVTVAVTIGVFVADLTYGVVDPTVESRGRSGRE
jgi:peptide/nickel transport system permease protein